jgi:hypothetical protein
MTPGVDTASNGSVMWMSWITGGFLVGVGVALVALGSGTVSGLWR